MFHGFLKEDSRSSCLVFFKKDFLKFFSVAMATRILHGIQFFEQFSMVTIQGIFK
jgi:hypothetical protein